MLPRSKDYSLCYLPGMAISRRQFFRGLVGPTPEQLKERRLSAVETYVRTNLLPYDFGLSAEQTAEAMSAAIAEVDLDTIEDGMLTYQHCLRIRDTVEEKVQRWRDEYLKAEEVRREAIHFVREFLSIEAEPDDLEALRQRFHVPYPAALEGEIEHQVQNWLGGLSNARLAGCDPAAIRDLVLSELRSWC
jgi:hypothetical protein